MGDVIGYGIEGGKDKFAIKQINLSVAVAGKGFHLAFAAKSRENVDKFYDAIKCGQRILSLPIYLLQY